MKNSGILPLGDAARTIGVIGPNADEVMTLLGNYYGTPSHPVTPLAGIKAAAGSTRRVLYARGCDLVEGRQDPRAVPAIDAAFLRPSAGSMEHGLRGEYFNGRDLAGTPVVTRTDRVVDFRWDRSSPTADMVARGELDSGRALASDDFSIRWTGQLLPPVTGTYEITVTADDGFRLDVAGARVLDEWTTTPRARAKTARVALEAGKSYDIRLEYFEAQRDAEVRLNWKQPGAKMPLDEALDVAKASDVVLFFGGLNGEVEGEEMPVSYPGFAGGDRTDIALPSTQDTLLRALQATGKPIVLILMTGSAIASEWAQQTLPAILVAWYPGQQGGNAIADVLFGKTNPSGRLPVTFYRSVSQLPAFADYDMKGRTYRYFGGDPLYPFGFGLSYTTFTYSGLAVDHARVKAGDPVVVSMSVKNSGTRDGHEVVQVYVRALNAPVSMPLKSLRAFSRVAIAAGQTTPVRFTLVPAKDFAHYDEATKALIASPGEYEIQVGASSHDIRLSARVTVE